MVPHRTQHPPALGRPPWRGAFPAPHSAARLLHGRAAANRTGHPELHPGPASYLGLCNWAQKRPHCPWSHWVAALQSGLTFPQSHNVPAEEQQKWRGLSPRGDRGDRATRGAGRCSHPTSGLQHRSDRPGCAGATADPRASPGGTVLWGPGLRGKQSAVCPVVIKLSATHPCRHPGQNLGHPSLLSLLRAQSVCPALEMWCFGFCFYKYLCSHLCPSPAHYPFPGSHTVSLRLPPRHLPLHSLCMAARRTSVSFQAPLQALEEPSPHSHKSQ